MLAAVRSHLTKEKIGAIAQSRTQAISGLGGIGKTQTAVEYAYRYRDRYTAVFWVRAETLGELQTGFVEIARDLALPEKDAQDPSDTVKAVREWLVANPGWLLIFDNADTPTLLKDFRPWQNAGNAVGSKQSHILLTSRAQTFDSLGIARPVSLAKMPEGEAIYFLLKRTGRNPENESERAAMTKIVAELGYLPLALEQAGAYILEQQMMFIDYLKSYSKRRLVLLERKRPVTGNYPESVATTWSLNFQAVEESSQASADLLRVSAFLSPDAIPYELFSAGAHVLGPALLTALSDVCTDPTVFTDLLAPLTRYSLVWIDIEKRCYSIARLVQEVLKTAFSEDERNLWIKRTTEAVEQSFPASEYANWLSCARLLPHAKVCIGLLSRYEIKSRSAGRLLNEVGVFLNEQGRYDEVESVLLQAVKISKQNLGENHHDLSASLNNLATLYQDQQRYEEAEPLLLQTLEIARKSHETNEYSILNNLASVYQNQGRHERAELLFLQSIKIVRAQAECSDITFATILNNLAHLYQQQNRYQEAESLFLQVLEIAQTTLESGHPNIAKYTNNLAILYFKQKRYEQAERLYFRALKIGKKAFGDNHPDIARWYGNLAVLYQSQGRLNEAEQFFLEAIKELEHIFGEDFIDIAHYMDDLSDIYLIQERFREAQKLSRRAFRIFKTTLGINHSSTKKTREKFQNILLRKNELFVSSNQPGYAVYLNQRNSQ